MTPIGPVTSEEKMFENVDDQQALNDLKNKD